MINTTSDIPKYIAFDSKLNPSTYPRVLNKLFKNKNEFQCVNKDLIFIFDHPNNKILLSDQHKSQERNELLNISRALRTFNSSFLIFDGTKVDFDQYLDEYGDKSLVLLKYYSYKFILILNVSNIEFYTLK